MKQANLRRKWSTIPKAGWSWGCVSAIDSEGRTIWIADAHRDDKRFILRANDKLTAFVSNLKRDSRLRLSQLDNSARFFQTWRR